MNKQPWVVTGAAGFLGSHVVEQLRARNLPVIAIDNLAWGRREHLKCFARDQDFEHHELDIRDTAAVANLFVRVQPTAVVHLAALHFIPAAVADPPLAVSINVYGTQSVLTASRQAGVQRFWFASTGDVYEPSEKPHREGDRLAPFNIYGLTKLLGEQLVALEATTNPDRHFAIGRLFNLYGPRETNPHILPEVLLQLRTKPDSPLRLGNIWPRRDMVPVEDAAKAIIECVGRIPSGLTTVNIATGVAWSVQDMLNALGELRGRPLVIESDVSKVRAVERPHLQADVEQLKALLGWTPHSDLRRGLGDLLALERRGMSVGFSQ